MRNGLACDAFYLHCIKDKVERTWGLVWWIGMGTYGALFLIDTRRLLHRSLHRCMNLIDGL